MLINRGVLLVFVASFLSAHGDEKKPITVSDHGDPQYDRLLADNSTAKEAKSLRELILADVEKEQPRDKSTKAISEISSLKENLLKSTASGGFSLNLTEMLKDEGKVQQSHTILGIGAAEAIADPNINVIDSHVSQVVQTSGSKELSFQPDADEMKTIAKERFQDTNFHNLYRENLQIKFIREEPKFRFGEGVQQWKHLSISENITALIGRAPNKIVILTGYNQTYELMKTIEFEIPPHIPLHLEVLTIFDSKLNRPRHLVLVAFATQIHWFEIFDNDVNELHRWNLLKEIDSVIHFTHEGSEILLVITIDESKRVQAEFIEFNVPDSEFWVIQTFKLPICPPSMAHLDLGKDFIVAFAQNDNVTIYRYQSTKHMKGKFTLFRTIDAANVSSVSGFRIGGYSYLAIGGDEPSILRYIDGNFVQQTILSQTFGYVEEYLPVIVRTYRDDLILLVQHRIELATHTLEVVDALIWNGIAFESALSVPCQISADPSANGFTCMLDLERESGLLGATSVHHEKENGLYFVIPRSEAHSGLFKVDYAIVEAEDPLLKDIEQMKKSIEFINKMLDYEEEVRKEVEEALKISVNPSNEFSFEGLRIEEIEAEYLEFLATVKLESDVIEFLNMNWSQDDFLVDLDNLEKTIQADEERLKAINIELNKLNRVNRQAQVSPTSMPNSPIHNIGAYTFNGNLDPKSISELQKISQTQSNSRPRRQIEPLEQSRVSSLTVKNIDLQTINGIPASDLIFLTNGQLVVPDSNVTFLNSVSAGDVKMLNKGRVNGIDFSSEVLAVESSNPLERLVFDNLIVDSLEVEKLNEVAVDEKSLNEIDVPLDIMPNITAKSAFIRGDLNIETINGIDWNEFVSKLVPKHLPSSIEEVAVEGNVIVVGGISELAVNQVNNIPFPEGFVLSEGPTGTVVTGKKSFEGELVTHAIDMDPDGVIDGIKPMNMITLDGPGVIPTETTFEGIEVLKKLEVNGTIAGRQLNDFLPNPTLSESKEIAAACSFKELIVRGRVIVEGLFSGQNLESTLSDVVYETHDGSEVVIAAPKVFTDLEVQGNIAISNNFINDLNVDNILTTDGDQVLLLNQLHGRVFISNLKLSGLFDGVNATELEHDSVRTFGEQFIETPLFVIDGRVGAKSANVREFLNQNSVGDFMFIDNDLELSKFKMINFNELEAETLRVNGDIVGPGTLQSLNLQELQTNYLSKSRKQKIMSPVKVKSLTTNGTFSSKTINSIDFDVFINYMRSIRNFKSLVLSGEQKLDNLVIDGNILVESINDKDFNQIVANVIWLNRQNKIEGNLKFLDDITVEGALNINGDINKKPCKQWLDNWVSKKEKTIQIHSAKTFSSDVIVEESLETKSINGISFEDLLMAKDVVKLPFLNINGNVNVDKLKVDTLINKNAAKMLTDIYSYDPVTYVHTVHSDIHFNHPTNVIYLNTPILNKLDVSAWLSNLIRTDESNVYISGEKILAEQFLAQQGIYIDYVNDIKMDFLDQVVLNEPEPSRKIEGSLLFVSDVYANLVGVKGNLFARFISSCDTMEWKEIALMTDNNYLLKDAMHIKSSALKSSNLTTSFLNKIPFASIFTLKTTQTFAHEIKILGSVAVKQPLIVRGNVNGRSLEHERANTVMSNEQHQEVTVKTTFDGARVSGDLKTYGKINSKTLQNAVLLNSSPTIESAVNFKSLQGSSLYSSDAISGTNFSKWYDNVLWARGKDEQIVSGNWDVKKLQFSNGATGNGLINEMSIHEIEKNLQVSINSIDAAISNHSGKYQQLCSELSNKANESRNSIYIIKHFELEFKVNEADDIFSHFAFKTSSDKNYLAVNSNCTTRLYKWMRKEERFRKVASVVTGVVYNWLLVKNAKHDVFIVTNSKMLADNPCLFGGLNVWKISEDQMFHVNSISNETDILELRANEQPGRFFTLNDLDVVTHLDVLGEKKESWQLPEDHYNYSFIPPEVTRDLTLFNGRNIYVLDSKFKSRQARWLWDSSPRMEQVNVETRPGDSPIIKFRMPDGNAMMHSLPSIPAKPLVTSKQQNDFVMKMKQFGDVVRKSLSEPLKDFPKLRDSKESLPKGKDSKVYNIKAKAFTEAADYQRKNEVKIVAAAEPSVVEEVTATDSANKAISSQIPIMIEGDIANITVNGNNVIIERLHTSTVEPLHSSTTHKVEPLTTQKPLISTLQKIGTGIKSAFEGMRENLLGSEQNESTTENNVKSDELELPASTSSPTYPSTSSATTLNIHGTQTETSTSPTQQTVKVTVAQEFTTTKSEQGKGKGPILPLAPRIFLEPEDHDVKKVVDPTESPTEVVEEKEADELEQQVPIEILPSFGIRVAENSFIPEQGTGEFIMMYVGPRRQKQALFAVTRTRDSKIKGNHNIIEIFYDVFEGSIYQYIHCTDPSNLVSLQFRDETLFAFLEGRHEIHVYIYRGVQGFVGFKRIQLPGYANQMTTVTLPPKLLYKCDQHYLLVRMDTEILFYGVKISGNCGLDVVHCDANY